MSNYIIIKIIIAVNKYGRLKVAYLRSCHTYSVESTYQPTFISGQHNSFNWCRKLLKGITRQCTTDRNDRACNLNGKWKYFENSKAGNVAACKLYCRHEELYIISRNVQHLYL